MSRFARSYAKAFLEAIPEGYDVETFLSRASDVAKAIASDPRLKNFLAAPAVPLETKSRLAEELSKSAGLDEFGTRFVGLVLQNRRILWLREILAAIRAARDKQLGVVEATVVLAGPVGDVEKGRIEEALARQLGRKVRMSVEVNPAILAGFVARVGSEVFDASVVRAIEKFQGEAGEGPAT
jgi:F-type H+-transporting ATPase subunit delta